MGKKLFLGILGVVVIAVIGLIVFRHGNRSQTTSADSLYDFSTVGRMDLSEKVDASGNVIVSTNSDIYPAFESTVKQILCKAGDTVKKGQLLMTLESPALELQWSDAANSVDQAQQNLDQANKDLKNTKALFDIQGATSSQVDDAQNKVTLYEQQLASARLKLSNLQNYPDNANFLDSNHRNLLIRAPFNGVIAWINCVNGSHVLPQASLLSVTADNSLEIEAQVDESEVKMIQPGQSVDVTSSDPDQPNSKGIVTEVGTIGTTTSGIVNFPVHIKVPRSGSNLKAGMSVDVTIMVSSYPNVLAVPANAVVMRRGKTMVGLKDQDGVSYVRVETGIKSGANIEIVSGLKDGDVIGIEKPKTSTTTSNSNNRSGGGGMRMGFGGFGR